MTIKFKRRCVKKRVKISFVNANSKNALMGLDL